MIEVTARLRFTRECLGSVKAKKAVGHFRPFRMPRMPGGKVRFLPSWWRKGVTYAAKVLNRHQNLAGRIEWDSAIDGQPGGTWKRWVKPNGGQPGYHAEHECFLPGQEIGVNAVLPSGISIQDFWNLLEIVGTYRGVSPHLDRGEQYGTFEVLSVQRRRRRAADGQEATE